MWLDAWLDAWLVGEETWRWVYMRFVAGVYLVDDDATVRNETGCKEFFSVLWATVSVGCPYCIHE